MKKRLFAGLLSLAMVLTSIVTVQPVSAADNAASGTTYYVSSIHGSDRNDGLSESKPFYSLDKINDITLQPGDKVLLEAGSVFTNGYLHIKGSGSEEAPIIIDRYGEGSDPRIDTNGQGIWYQDYGKQLDSASHKYQGYVSSSILLYDVEYIEINNLEITNDAPDIEATYNYIDVMNRTGVSGVAQNKGTLEHIYLNGLNIHDVIGNVYDKHMNNGGIYLTVAKPKDEDATGISRYDGVKIENCIVDNCNRWGIAVGYTAYWDKFQGAAISDETSATYGSGNVEIRNNYIKDVGGDAITTMYCDRPLIEYNVSDGAARQINTTDYSATGSGRVAAAIWPWKCKDAVFQYNEAFDTCYNQDSQAWDADWGDGTLYQYNYSHNNGGGSVMFCGSEAYQNIFRYNISYNDLSGVINPAGNPDAHVYNNTFYIKEGVDFIRTNMAGGKMVVENNIIYYSGTTRSEEWTKQGTNATYSHNLYYGYRNLPVDDALVDADPMFVQTEEAPTAYTGVNPLEGKTITYSRDSVFDMFKLQAGSPAIDAGKEIADNGGKDFFGNAVTGMPDIGAYESNSAPVIGSTDCTIHETVYMTKGTTVYVPSLSGNGTTAAEVKGNVTVNEKASVAIVNGDASVADSAAIADGMSIRVTAESGAVRDYTISIKNTYQWALDYAGQQQGNVWFAQEKNTDGTYSNLTEYDSTYPNWVTATWYGVGIDEESHSVVPTESTHGLIMDVVGSAQKAGVSMAWRAPKAGKIRFTLKDDEPYLRQSTNSGGTVTLKVTKKGDVVNNTDGAPAQCVLETSLTRVPIGTVEIEVQKGDYIRLEAVNTNSPSKPSAHATPTIEYIAE